MKRSKIIILSLFVILLTVTYSSYASNDHYAGLSIAEKKQIYYKLKDELMTKQEILKNNPSNKDVTFKEIKEIANDVQKLAKEVDAENYYKKKLNASLDSLEGTIKDETMLLKNAQYDSETIQKWTNVLEQKKTLLEEYKIIRDNTTENYFNVYDELRGKARAIIDEFHLSIIK